MADVQTRLMIDYQEIVYHLEKMLDIMAKSKDDIKIFASDTGTVKKLGIVQALCFDHNARIDIINHLKVGANHVLNKLKEDPSNGQGETHGH